MLHRAILGIGSNKKGVRTLNISASLTKIGGEIAEIEKYSEIYETLPFGREDSGDVYKNMVAIVVTAMEYEEFNKALKIIEKQAGRNCDNRHGKIIPLDVDIVIWDGNILKPKDLERDYFRIGYKSVINNVEDRT